MGEVKAPLKLYAIYHRPALKLLEAELGKFGAQSGHAFCHALWDAERRFPETAQGYKDSDHAYKIGLVAPRGVDESWFDALLDKYRDRCGVTKVVDAGFTVFEGPTFVGVGIGPISPDDCEEILRGLKPLKTTPKSV